MSSELRKRLVDAALEWQRLYGVAPAITAMLSEYDAAMLVGATEQEYSADAPLRTAVSPGHDFMHAGMRYQVKANRPSGKPGSPVTLVSKAKNFDWDKLIWILYNPGYEMVEAWIWDVEKYRADFESKDRLAPSNMRNGKRLFPPGAPVAIMQQKSPELKTDSHGLALGQRYSRKEINSLLGGGVMDFLPHAGGLVVAGCFTRDLNPDVPKILLPGNGLGIIRWASVFAGQKEPVPVFIKKNVNKWEYVGKFLVDRCSTDGLAIQQQSRRTGRDDISMVLFLRNVGT